MDRITQEMKFRHSLVKYAKAMGVTKTARKYNKCRQYIYFWLKRYDGTIESLGDRSRRPRHHPNQHTPAEVELVKRIHRHNKQLGLMELWFKLRDKSYIRHFVSLYRLLKRLGVFKNSKDKKPKYIPKPYEQMQYPGQRVQVDVKKVPRECVKGDFGDKYYQYTAIDEYSRLRYLGAFEQANTYSSEQFLMEMVAWFAKKNIKVECVQTDNGFEFTKRFAKTREERNLTLFEMRMESLGIRHKLIRPYTPRHNGKVERSHREDQKRFYNRARFFSFQDFATQLKRHNQRSNNIPMRPLNYRSPLVFLAACV